MGVWWCVVAIACWFVDAWVLKVVGRGLGQVSMGRSSVNFRVPACGDRGSMTTSQQELRKAQAEAENYMNDVSPISASCSKH